MKCSFSLKNTEVSLDHKGPQGLLVLLATQDLLDSQAQFLTPARLAWTTFRDTWRVSGMHLGFRTHIKHNLQKQFHGRSQSRLLYSLLTYRF